MARRLSRSSSYFALRATGSKSNPGSIMLIVTYDCHFVGCRPSASAVEGPAPDTLAGQEAAEAQPREVGRRHRHVAALQLPRVGLPDPVGRLLVDVHEQVELVVHELQRAVD